MQAILDSNSQCSTVSFDYLVGPTGAWRLQSRVSDSSPLRCEVTDVYPSGDCRTLITDVGMQVRRSCELMLWNRFVNQYASRRAWARSFVFTTQGWLMISSFAYLRFNPQETWRGTDSSDLLDKNQECVLPPYIGPTLWCSTYNRDIRSTWKR